MMGNSRPWRFQPIFFFIAFGLLLPAGYFITFSLSPLQPENTQSTLVEIHKGQSANEITKSLITKGIVADSRSFQWLGRLTRQWKKIKAGEYRLSPSMTPAEIYSTLTSGISAAHPITVREGENIFEIAEDLESHGLTTQKHFLSLCHDSEFISSLGLFKASPPPSLEGYLFPDTYFFDHTLSDSDIIKQMTKHFFKVWGAEQEGRAHTLKMNRHQAITLASMIEKETGASEERPLISSIFHNRLKAGMKLQSDPTTIYGMWAHYEGKIHKKDLSAKNEYNTYYVQGLPAGPIGNPGKESIQAALYPSTSSFLYFVSHNDGTHQFSRTLEEHNLAVKKFQLDPRAREGKSWRDHLKQPVSLYPQAKKP